MQSKGQRRTPAALRFARWICALVAIASPIASLAADRELPIAPAGASAQGVFHDQEERVEARLLIHPDDTASGGPVRIGVLLRIDPDWHVYWKHPGESGLPTRIDLSVEGGSVGPLAWPAPEVFAEADGMFTTFGYEESVLLTATAQPTDRSALSPDARVRAEIELLACRSECVPGRFSLQRRLDPGAEAGSDAVRALFARSAERLPVAPESLGLELAARYDRSAIRPGDAFQAALSVTPCADGADPCLDVAIAPGSVVWLPDPPDGIEMGSAVLASNAQGSRGFRIDLEARAGDADPAADQRLRGVLPLRDETGALHAVAVDVPLPRARSGEEVAMLGPGWQSGPGASAPPSSGLLRAVFFAFIGGLILNLMPCVLPVLAIKVFSLAEMAQHARREVIAQGVAYASGILISMWALASVVTGLRMAGNLVGWGFQFQEPLFVMAIATLLVVFSLNLFGVFEIGFDATRVAEVGREATGSRRSFFEGLLAVVLATPCTAPFLGTAVGFAFASPGSAVFAIFTAVGVGLALPFVLVSFVPAWRGIIPRSGAWMLKLRAGLGFALLASVVWLLWVASRFVGADGVVAMLALLLTVAFGVWAFGNAQGAGRRAWSRGLGVAVLAIAVGGPMLIRLEPVPEATGPGEEGHGSADQPRPYDRAAVSAELAAGRTAFVVFTADWCITCKVNEKVVIADESVRAEIQTLGVTVFKADWTRRDDEIRAELARFGRAGVPLYLVYSPEAPEQPVVLPELLRADGLIAALRDAAGGDTELAAPRPSEGEAPQPVSREAG